MRSYCALTSACVVESAFRLYFDSHR